MRFSRLFSTLIASFSLYILTPTVASAQGTTPDPTDAITNFFHSCSDTGCQWVAPDGAAGSYIECSCNTQPPGWADLAWFYTLDNFAGLLYKGFGHFNQCYKLPSFWYANGGSMQVNQQAVYSCHVYTTPDCTGDYADIRGDVQEFLGLYRNGVRSFLCLQKS